MATVVLPVPGFPVNDMCSDGGDADRPWVDAHALDEEQRGDLVHAVLDRHESDELAVECIEDLPDARCLVLALEIDSRRRLLDRRGLLVRCRGLVHRCSLQDSPQLP